MPLIALQWIACVVFHFLTLEIVMSIPDSLAGSVCCAQYRCSDYCQLLVTHIVLTHGAPRTLLTDRKKNFSHRLSNPSTNFLTKRKLTQPHIIHKQTVLSNNLTIHFANPCQCTSAVTRKTRTHQRFGLVFELVLTQRPEIVHSTYCTAVNQDFLSMFLSFLRLN